MGWGGGGVVWFTLLWKENDKKSYLLHDFTIYLNLKPNNNFKIAGLQNTKDNTFTNKSQLKYYQRSQKFFYKRNFSVKVCPSDCNGLLLNYYNTNRIALLS